MEKLDNWGAMAGFSPPWIRHCIRSVSIATACHRYVTLTAQQSTVLCHIVFVYVLLSDADAGLRGGQRGQYSLPSEICCICPF